MASFNLRYADIAPAVEFAAQLHAEQTRKGTSIPCISHLLAAAGIVLEHRENAIEDQGETCPGGVGELRAVIETRFGRAVMALVEGCTDADTYPKPRWRERKERYIAHLATA